ncbi:MAG TPA: sigma factor-like helix-turn-helix DNA-binding protein, partial [Candidatus Paceibacterota bacterium]|nr:sigma factor-like helix-turn-helix DNA-binding protein [Candidatus Paceibacterota bacterium]
MQPNLVTSALSGTISIPAHARSWALAQMPLSVRLEGVLQKMGLRQMGELHGLAYVQISSMRNCGRRTIRELLELVRRVHEGEFDCGAMHGLGLEHLIRQVDQAVDDLSEREREILRMRLGGRDRDPMTLEEIGGRFGLTRERARQLLDLMFQRIARHGGPFTFLLLDRLADKCLGMVCPLTPELLPLWLGAKTSASKRVPVFYVRLFSELDPRIPAWPDGQRPNPNLSTRAREIIRPAIESLRRHVTPMAIIDLYRDLEAQATVPNLNASDLLLALKQSASITVTTSAPDRPVARLGSLRICDWVHQVLSQSDRPLRPEEILRRGRRMFGPEIPHTSVGGLRNSLRPEQGIFLLDRRAFGIDRHIQLPERLRAKARSDVARL